jgi:protein Tex
MVWCGLPRAVHELHLAELIQCNATPVGRRPRWFQTAFAFSTKLITEHPELTLPVPAQPMRTQQTGPVVINGSYRPSGHNRFAHHPVTILDLPCSTRSGTRHSLQINSVAQLTRDISDIYNTVILASIEEQGKLTPDLKARIDAAMEKSELEDLYLPFKPKRRTKATIAREKGLEPLAVYLWEQQPGDAPLTEFAASFVNLELGVSSVDEALEGARHIIAEKISEHAEIRKLLRQTMMAEGVIVSRKIEDAEDAEEKFQMYYDYREPARSIPSHRMLAIRRGENEKILYFTIDLEPARALALIKSQVHRQPGDWTPQLELACEDAWKRLLQTSIQGEIRLELKQRADVEAIQVFRDNLQNLLLAPPAGAIAVLGIDPGIRTGCKIAVVDETGRFLAHDVIYPHPPKNDRDGAEQKLKGIIAKHNVRAIAIGNGTASRETDAFVRDFLNREKPEGVFAITVNESGASVYSASDLAREEFPELDLTVRGAISIARRLQDPLAELVKIDPKSIGVGQYQHDVDQRQLEHSLGTTIESCVNRVGVDLNTASWAVLRHIAGINERTAKKIVEYRDDNGRFRSRVQLTAVPGVGPKTFEQAAGFLRIRGGDNPLDMTAVHPESYPVVRQIVELLGVSMEHLIQEPELLKKVDKSALKAGTYTVSDILEELKKPGRDPREQFVAPSFQEGIHEISDLRPGMKLEGVVTNVTKFGAFVDIGVHQDGLVHISELSHHYVKDPGEVVKAGQIVKVQVLNVDPKTKRIALSMKALMPTISPQPKPRHASVDPLATLSTKDVSVNKCLNSRHKPVVPVAMEGVSPES